MNNFTLEETSDSIYLTNCEKFSLSGYITKRIQESRSYFSSTYFFKDLMSISGDLKALMSISGDLKALMSISGDRKDLINISGDRKDLISISGDLKALMNKSGSLKDLVHISSPGDLFLKKTKFIMEL